MGNTQTALLPAREADREASLVEIYGEMLSEARIQLADGTMMAPFAPHAEAFTRENISVGLSNICRFGGQMPRFYSVAQHSVLVAALCENNHDSQIFALLHDAEEAFGLPDLPTPIKPFLPDVVEAQAVMCGMIFERYGVDASLKPRVKPSDTLALSMEKRDLKIRSKTYLADLPRPPSRIHIDPLQPDAAHGLFDAAMRRVFDEGLPITREWILSGPGFSETPLVRAA